MNTKRVRLSHRCATTQDRCGDEYRLAPLDVCSPFPARITATFFGEDIVWVLMHNTIGDLPPEALTGSRGKRSASLLSDE